MMSSKYIASGFALLVCLWAVNAQDAPAVRPAVQTDSTSVDTAKQAQRRQRPPRTPRPPRPGVFTSLDSARTMPDSVLVLNLRGKGMVTITGLAAFKNLKTLDLSENKLSAFPREITTLQQLGTLDLSDNPIGTVPDEIGLMTGLSRLNLRNTGIKTVPLSIGKCSRLSTLDVSKNPLASLPVKELNLLPNLRTVTLGSYQAATTSDTTKAPIEPSQKK